MGKLPVLHYVRCNLPVTPHLQTARERDYDAIEAAGAAAREAVLPGREDVKKLAAAVAMSYSVQASCRDDFDAVVCYVQSEGMIEAS